MGQKTKICVMIIVTIALASPMLAQGASFVGNGGDVVRCRVSLENPLNGDYALDYVAGIEPGEIVPAPSGDNWRFEAARIYTQLYSRFPKLALSFMEYVNDIGYKGLGRPYQWHEASYGLVD